jgi:NADPH:quinone reductase-like Zn-dependent oxidoreductase
MKLRRVLGWAAVALFSLALIGGLGAYWASDNDCESRGITAPREPMKAMIYCDYGTAEVLQFADVEKPVPDTHEVLVKVHAAAVNPLDWHFMRGTPYVMRLQSGLRKPAVTRIGVDFAGTVEAVGSEVTTFKPGDAVFGGRTGAFADYVVVRADRGLAHKPANMSFEQVAAVPIAAITALQALRDAARLKPGESVLINGASGGVGTFAVQVARALGAEVTGVCSTRNLELVRSLGAARVIDYKHEDFTQDARRYDVILDNVGNRALADIRQVLKPEGRYILIGGGGPDAGPWVEPLVLPLKTFVTSAFVSQELRMFVSHMDGKDLAVLADMMAAGQITPVIDRTFPLAELPDAIRYLETGRARGKVVITVSGLQDLQDDRNPRDPQDPQQPATPGDR